MQETNQSINLKMEQSTPQITTQEIQEWENKFKESVSPLVKFTPTGQDSNSMRFYNGESGVDATWSGIIILGNDDYVKWNFTIQNEPFIESKLNLTQENFNIFSNLYNFYNEWKQEWSKQISMPDNAMNSNDQDKLPLKENKRTKANIITEHSQRMRILAGLR